jgi:hypothetical protein
MIKRNGETYPFKVHLHLPPHTLNSTHSKGTHIRNPSIIHQNTISLISTPVSFPVTTSKGNSLNNPQLPLNLPKNLPRILQIRNITTIRLNLDTLLLARSARSVLFRGTQVQEREGGAGLGEREGYRCTDSWRRISLTLVIYYLRVGYWDVPPAAPVTTASFPLLDFAKVSGEMAG